MPLTTAQSAAYTRLRQTSGSGQAVQLTDDAVRALIYITANDLGLEEAVGDPAAPAPGLFHPGFTADLVMPGPDPKALYERLVHANPESETYVSCAAAIHKARLKYQRVLSTQPLASMDQIAPRALLQYGQVESFPLAAFLTWRKWLYDLDNRAAQDTGYLFEPVIAGAVGGVPYSASRSPIRRSSGRGGRQVDCLKDDKAYEIKLRITIAASGQGRWSEELQFPAEASASGYTPVLVVLDPTPNPKLRELRRAFETVGGQSYVGDDAWNHLESEAGPEMALFLERYVRTPLNDVYFALDDSEPLPVLELWDRRSRIDVSVGGAHWTIPRQPGTIREHDEVNDLPDDVGDFLPGLAQRDSASEGM